MSDAAPWVELARIVVFGAIIIVFILKA